MTSGRFLSLPKLYCPVWRMGIIIPHTERAADETYGRRGGTSTSYFKLLLLLLSFLVLHYFAEQQVLLT